MVSLPSRPVGHDGQRAVAARGQRELCIGLVAPRRAMVAITIGVEPRDVDHVTDSACLALRIDVGLAQSIAAAGGRELDARGAFAIAREQLDHAAGVVAI